MRQATSLIGSLLFVAALGLVAVSCSSGSSSSGGSGTSGSGGSGTGGSGTGGTGGSGTGGTGGSGGGASGDDALAYLRATPYDTLRVEVDYVTGFAPDAAALNLLSARLGERCDKPGGVTIDLDDAIPDPGAGAWSLGAIQNLEATHRDTFSSGTTAVLYVLYLNDASDQDSGSSKVLGLSYSGSSFCIFLETIQTVATVGVTAPTIERAVLIHEAGHNLGLVNNGVAMVTPHQDTANGRHDTDSSCVMHYTIETNLIANLLGTVPDQFGANCIADMQAAGGK